MHSSKAQGSRSTLPTASSPLRNPISASQPAAKDDSEKPFKSKASNPKDSPADSRYSGAWWNPFSRTNKTAAIKSTIKQAASSSTAVKAQVNPPPTDAEVKERKLFVPRHAGRDARLSIPISERQELSKIQSNIKTSRQLLAERLEEERSLRREALLRQGPNGVVWDGGVSPTHFSRYAGNGWAPGEYLRAARESILPGVVEEPDTSQEAAAVAAMAGLSFDASGAMSIRSSSSSSLSPFYTAPGTPGPKYAGRDSPVADASRARKAMHRQSLGSVTEQAIKQAYLEGFKHGANVAPHAVTAGGDTYAQLTASRRNPLSPQQQQARMPASMKQKPQIMVIDLGASPLWYEGKGKGRAKDDTATTAILSPETLPPGRPRSMIAHRPLKLAEPRQIKRDPMRDSLANPESTDNTAIGASGDMPKATADTAYALSNASSDPRSSFSRSATGPSWPASERGGSVATPDTAQPMTPDTPLSVGAEAASETTDDTPAIVKEASADLDNKGVDSSPTSAHLATSADTISSLCSPGDFSGKLSLYGSNDSESQQEYEYRHELESEYDWSEVEAWLQASAISMTPGQARPC